MTRLLCAVAMTAAPAATAAQPASLADVLARAEQYVTQYERRFSALVAEEHYVQEVRRPAAQRGGVRESRTLRSDYLLVQLDAGAGWMPFRDVFEVDGRRLRDREDRLGRLFMVPATEAAFDQATRIMADSTRYNLGGVTRTINVPTLALLFLHPDLRPRFQFKHTGTEVVAGHDAWTLEFRETHRPTLIKTSNGRDLALTGRLWVDPSTGVIVKTHLTAADPAVRANVTVTFREDADLDLWVPAQMDEHYKAARDPNDIHGLATYDNYRTFQVRTDENLRKPPGGEADDCGAIGDDPCWPHGPSTWRVDSASPTPSHPVEVVADASAPDDALHQVVQAGRRVARPTRVHIGRLDDGAARRHQPAKPPA